MLQSLAAALKRLHIRRLWLIVALVLVLLLGGWIVREGLRTGRSETASGGSATPTQSIATSNATNNGTSPAMVTVITLTPTRLASAMVQMPTSTLPASSAQEQAPLTPSPLVSTPAPDLSPVIVNIKTDLLNLYRMMEVTQVMLQTFSQGQPTEEERIALQAQLNVVSQRMEKLAVQLQSAQAASETFGTDARISPSPTATPVATSTPTPASVTNTDPLDQMQAMLDEMADLLREMQSLLQQLPN